MRLRHIEVFQAVMETGSMSAAARLIHLTQSAVSRSVAGAELQLGYPLFHRVGGRLVPTTEGLALFEESSAIFEKLESLKRTAHNLKSGEQGVLRIAAIPAVCHKLLPDALARFHPAHPQVTVEVHTVHKRQIAAELLTRSVDLGLDYYTISHPGVQARSLGVGPLYAMLPGRHARALPGLSSKALVELLARLPVVALTDDDPLYMAFLRWCEHQAFRPAGRVLVQTSQLAEELVARDLGWTVVDFRTAAMRRKDVVVAPLQPYVECSMNAFFAKNHSPTLLARRMADTVKAVLRETA
ncbi:MAG TPA: LysR family transcriptional regulator [Albitalea sp.]|uniref:LysR family transcriptional regulator n=1 Tax=Piscinibacter sp. TaxID=1903157 RepID=UPI002ED5CFC9